MWKAIVAQKMQMPELLVTTTPVETVDYYPYGDQRIASSSSAFSEQKKYPGHDYDADSDLTYAKQRYYSQNVGRFMTQDPFVLQVKAGSELLVDPQQLNSYSYARNNPLRFIDPNGMSIRDDITAVLNSLVTLLNQLLTALGGGSQGRGSQGEEVV